jgi:HPt (histidine-containing phosphotransfer) domain-containing protein
MGEEEFRDRAALEKLMSIGGKSLVLRMIELFETHTPDRLDGARKALEAGDMKSFERYMHSMKSSAANLGATRMRARAAEAERLAGEGEESGAILAQHLAALERERDEFDAFLETEKRRLDQEA